MRIAYALLTLSVFLPVSLLADQWDKHWTVSGTPELHVSAGDAAIEITGGSGSGIDAHLETKGWTIGESGVHLEERQNGNVLELTVKQPQSHFSFGNHSVRLQLRVPSSLNAYIRTGDGPVHLAGLHGTVHANTGDGPIRVDEFEGELEAHSGDGPVELNGRFDNLHVQTGDGPVKVSAAHGSQIRSGWRLQTGDGPVAIKLPGDLSATLNLHTGDGPINLDLPQHANGNEDKHNVHMALNGGGADLDVHTGDGPITIGRS